MPRRRRKKLGQGWRSFGWTALAGVFFTLAVMVIQWQGGFDTLSGYLLDVRMRQAQGHSPPPSNAVVHVDIDDDSTKSVGQRWPWDRQFMAYAIDTLREAGAKTIVLDLLLDEPQEERIRFDTRGQFEVIENDKLLGGAMGRAGSVLLGVHIAPVDAPEESGGAGASGAIAKPGAGELEGDQLTVEWPIDVILAGTTDVGFVNVGEATEGVRAVTAWADVEGERFYQLGIRATAEYLGIPKDQIVATDDELRIGDSIRVPLEDRRVIIPWRPRDLGEPTPWVQNPEPKAWERIQRRVPIHSFISIAGIRQDMRDRIGRLAQGAPLDRDITEADLAAAEENASWILEDFDGKSAEEVLAGLERTPENLDTIATLETIRSLPVFREHFERLPARMAELREIVEGKLVFVGYIQTGAYADFYPTALGVKTPGVCVHSAIANGLLTGHWISRAPRWLNLMMTLLAGLSATLVASALAPSRGWIAALLLTAGYVAFNAFIVFDRWDTWLALGAPVVAAVGSWATCTTIQAITERKAKAAVRRQFRARVSAQLVDYLSEHPDMINMDGEERELTIAFTDFVGFTSISEKLEGKQTVAILNRYLRAMTDVMLDHTAYVNKFLGDGIMAFWGAPAMDPRHASQACLAVVDCFDALDMLNEAPEFKDLPKLGMRAGISTGKVIVGDCGAPPRLNDYTVIGDAVNLAARLESANKMLGTRALVTQRTMDLMDDDAKNRILWRPMGRIRVVGQQQHAPVYELVARRDDPAVTDEVRDWIGRTGEAVDLFGAGRIEQAMEIWQDLVLFERGSAGALLYTERCAELLESKREDFFLPLRSK